MYETFLSTFVNIFDLQTRAFLWFRATDLESLLSLFTTPSSISVTIGKSGELGLTAI
jgi:hypothetical protein